MDKVRNILHEKHRNVISVGPETTVFEALDLMYQKNIGALLVLEQSLYVGVFTERDYARKVILQGKSSKTILIRDVMSSDAPVVSLNSTIEECMWLMTNKFIRYLPVMDNDQLVGIISIGDVVKHIIDEQKFIIGNLEHYINGSK